MIIIYCDACGLETTKDTYILEEVSTSVDRLTFTLCIKCFAKFSKEMLMATKIKNEIPNSF